ncbi:MAG: hypothetical protein KGL75_13145 [Acidobacteriota bacterium]|nr:hypothetical protein [Acidobacteriota bacterium]
MSPYTLIAVFAVFVLACLCLFLFLFLSPESAPLTTESEVRNSIAGLSLSNAPDFRLLFADCDYRQLRSRPELRTVSAKYRRDRRRCALLWLGELERDVRLVWEFRRFLVRNGLVVTLQEEVAIACAGSLALLYLNAIRLTVFLFGPFVFAGTLQAARIPVARLSRRGAGLLSQVPADVKRRLERKWIQHVLSWSPA